jgi:hypothetical protein
MRVVQYDDSKWPLYRVSMSSVDMDDEEFTTLVATLDGLFMRRERFGILLDVRSAPVLSAKRRQTVGEHAKRTFELFPGRCVGIAVVLSTQLQRGVFTAINWFLRGTHPSRAFSTLLDAETWLDAELLAATGREWHDPTRNDRSVR